MDHGACIVAALNREQSARGEEGGVEGDEERGMRKVDVEQNQENLTETMDGVAVGNERMSRASKHVITDVS